MVCRDCRQVIDTANDNSLRSAIQNHLTKHHKDQADQVDIHYQDIKHRRHHQSMCIKAFLKLANGGEKNLFLQRVVNKSLTCVSGVGDDAIFILTGFPSEGTREGYSAKSFEDILAGSKYHKTCVLQDDYQEVFDDVSKLLNKAIISIPDFFGSPLDDLADFGHLKIDTPKFAETCSKVDTEHFVKEVHSLMSAGDNFLLDFSVRVLKPPCDQFYDGKFILFCNKMTELLRTPPQGLEVIMCNTIELIAEHASKMIDLLSKKTLIALQTVRERAPNERNQLHALKENAMEMLDNCFLDKENLTSIVNDRPEVIARIGAEFTSSLVDTRKKVSSGFRNVASTTRKSYGKIFKDFLLFLIRLNIGSENDDWKAVCEHFAVKAKTYDQARTGGEKYKYTVDKKDAVMVANFLVQNMRLEQVHEESNNKYEITPAGLFCRARALKWTCDDLELSFGRDTILDNDAPTNVHKATSAILHMSRLSVVFVAMCKWNPEHVNLPHSKHILDLANLAGTVKPFESFLKSGHHAAEKVDGLSNVPYTQSFKVVVGDKPIVVHIGMIQTAIWRAVFDFKKILLDFVVDHVIENKGNTFEVNKKEMTEQQFMLSVLEMDAHFGDYPQAE